MRLLARLPDLGSNCNLLSLDHSFWNKVILEASAHQKSDCSTGFFENLRNENDNRIGDLYELSDKGQNMFTTYKKPSFSLINLWAGPFRKNPVKNSADYRSIFNSCSCYKFILEDSASSACFVWLVQGLDEHLSIHICTVLFQYFLTFIEILCLKSAF